MTIRRILLGAIFACSGLLAQDASEEVYSIGGDVQRPSALKKREPEYSDAARRWGRLWRGLAGMRD